MLELQAAGDKSTAGSSPTTIDSLNNNPPAQTVGTHLSRPVKQWSQSLWGSWRAYWDQPTFAAAIALALLYLTVLSLGLLMTAYLKAQGLAEAELAIERGIGALTGILATFTFPPMSSRLGNSLSDVATV